jgi:regulatory protein
MNHGYDKTREAALRILERRRRTRADVAQRLKEKGFEAADIEAVCVRLTEVGLLNDLEFARLYLQGRQGKPRGTRLLSQELRQKGVPAEVAEEALSQLAEASEGGEAELDRARSLARQSARKLAGLEPREARQKLFALLSRRGFGLDVIETVSRELASAREP